MLKLMYITNRPEIAKIASKAGVDRIFIDLEVLDKELRQGNMDTVKSHHKISDIPLVKAAITDDCELLVRLNHYYEGTKAEVDEAVQGGADIIMLPYYKTTEEVRKFLSFVDGRAKTMVLAETKEAIDIMDEVLSLDGLDEIYIGLNDMHLSLKRKFMFELLTDGTVEKLTTKIKAKGIPFGFGGIARLDYGMVPAQMIIPEHYRLGSEIVILSRSFCNVNKIESIDEIKSLFESGVKEVRDFEKMLNSKDEAFFEENRQNLIRAVDKVVAAMQ